MYGPGIKNTSRFERVAFLKKIISLLKKELQNVMITFVHSNEISE